MYKIAQRVAPVVIGLVLTGTGVAVASQTTGGQPAPPVEHVVPQGYVMVPADSNHDGRVDEDEPGWDCTQNGNRQCGPGAERPVTGWTVQNGTLYVYTR